MRWLIEKTRWLYWRVRLQWMFWFHYDVVEELDREHEKQELEKMFR